MLLKTLKSNQPYLFVLVPLIAASLWVSSFLKPAAFPFFAGEDAMLLYKPFSFLLSGHPLASSIVALVFVVLLAFLILKLNIQYAFIKARTFLPSSLFVLIVSGMRELHFMHPVYPATLFLLLSVDRLFNSYEKEIAHSNAFEIGVFLAIGSLFYFNLVFFAPFLWIGLSVIRSKVNWRDYILTTIGFLLPWVAALAYYQVVGEAEAFVEIVKSNITSNPMFFMNELSIQIYLGYLVVLTLLGSFFLLGEYDERKISSRKYFKAFFYIFIISCLLIVWGPSVSQGMMVVLAFPLTYLISNYLISMKRQFWGEVFIFILTAGVIVLQFI